MARSIIELPSDLDGDYEVYLNGVLQQGVGRGFGYVMIVLGGLEVLGGAPEGLWLALIGFFLVMASGQQAVGAQVQAALSGVHASDLIGRPVGLVSITDVKRSLRASRLADRTGQQNAHALAR